jgi:hypothetical protein
MPATLSTKLRLGLTAVYENTAGLAPVQAPLNRTDIINLLTGTGLNQADRIYTEQITIAGSANTERDLAGSLLDAFGAVITLARVKALIVIAAAGNANEVVIGAAAANGWFGPFGGATETVKVRPGGMTVLVAPDATAWPVVAGTGDKLKLANGAAGANVVFDLIIIGASA